MKNILIILTLASALAACAKHGDSSDEKGKGGKGGGQEKLENVTDYSMCTGERSGIIQGSWRMAQASENFRFDMIMQIGRTSTRFINNCQVRGRQIQASVEVPTTYDLTTYTVQQKGEDHQSLNDGDFKANCDVQVQPMTFEYTFQGPCLVVKTSQGSMMYVPAFSGFMSFVTSGPRWGGLE